MQVAVISDVHGNVQALEAVLAAIDAVQVDEIWCLGDVVGYGADPVRCMEIVDERSAVCLAGNHDLVVAGVIDIDMFAHDARDAAEWSRTVLDDEQIATLATRMPGGTRTEVQMFHGSIRDPVWEYVVDPRTAATLAYGEGPFIVNPGSVGQPRDGDPRAGYVVLDTEAGTATWLRADYDIRAAQDAIRDAGLPLRLAARLAEGR